MSKDSTTKTFSKIEYNVTLSCDSCNNEVSMICSIEPRICPACGDEDNITIRGVKEDHTNHGERITKHTRTGKSSDMDERTLEEGMAK